MSKQIRTTFTLAEFQALAADTTSFTKALPSLPFGVSLTGAVGVISGDKYDDGVAAPTQIRASLQRRGTGEVYSVLLVDNDDQAVGTVPYVDARADLWSGSQLDVVFTFDDGTFDLSDLTLGSNFVVTLSYSLPKP